ncbi:putative leader peptide [Streptomyces sp. NPDC093586]|uniref:putative leader peptide n=1 Tax=Streptomyces sp. NPDC093586 TaxID=3366042 RepID=UPI0038095572
MAGRRWPVVGCRSSVAAHRAGDRVVAGAVSGSVLIGRCPLGDGELTGPRRHGLLRSVTDTDVRLWRRVHMDLVRYAGCVCRPSC